MATYSKSPMRGIRKSGPGARPSRGRRGSARIRAAPLKSIGIPRAPRVPTHRKKNIAMAKRAAKRTRQASATIGSMEEDRAAMFFSNFQISNGKIENKKLSPNLTRINKGLDILEQQGVLNRDIFRMRPNATAEKFLFGINCTLSAEAHNFSLLGEQTDQETIENKNILDRREYTQLKIEYIEATDKFFEECDPFYNLDDRMPGNVRMQKDLRNKPNKPYLLKIASYASQTNLRNVKNRKLRYFKDVRLLKQKGNF